MMKLLAMLIAILAFGWSGYWLAGYWGVTTGFDRWFEDRRAQGWVAEYDDRRVLGFPNRFDTTFTNLTLADPASGVAWDMPFLQLFALSYRPNHVIAVWSPEQVLSTPTEKLTVSTEDMRASVVLRPDTALTLERSNLAIEGMILSSSADWRMSAQTLGLAMHRLGDAPATYRMALQSTNVAPPVAYRLPSGMQLPRTLATLAADMTVTFDKPWDRGAIEQARPQPTEIDITLAEIGWGDLQLNAAGRVTIDSFGYPSGTITLRAVNWREIIAVARATGRVSPGVLDTIEGALDLAAQLAGNARQLDIPLTFRNGSTRIGPVPFAPAPVIRLR